LTDEEAEILKAMLDGLKHISKELKEINDLIVTQS